MKILIEIYSLLFPVAGFIATMIRQASLLTISALVLALVFEPDNLVMIIRAFLSLEIRDQAQILRQVTLMVLGVSFIVQLALDLASLKSSRETSSSVDGEKGAS